MQEISVMVLWFSFFGADIRERATHETALLPLPGKG